MKGIISIVLIAMLAAIAYCKPIRNALGAKGGEKGIRLPYDAEVEYLESTGTQYIDTGAVVSKTSHIVVRMSNYSVAGRWMFGARRGYTTDSVGIYSNADTAVNKFRFSWGGSLSDWFIYTTIGVGVVTIDINAGLLTITRELIPNTYQYQITANNFRTPVPMYLFALNNNGELISCATMQLHGAQIDDVRDLIPVRFTNEQGQSEGAMYDRLGVGGMNPDGSPRTDGLYRNRGTGAFVIGPDKQH